MRFALPSIVLCGWSKGSNSWSISGLAPGICRIPQCTRLLKAWVDLRRDVFNVTNICSQSEPNLCVYRCNIRGTSLEEMGISAALDVFKESRSQTRELSQSHWRSHLHEEFYTHDYPPIFSKIAWKSTPFMDVGMLIAGKILHKNIVSVGNSMGFSTVFSRRNHQAPYDR